MRRVLRVVGILAIAILTFAVGLSAWLYSYTGDLSSISQLKEFNPVSETETQLRSCDGTGQTVLALPGEKLGRYTVAALIAAEGKPDTRSPFVALFSRGQQVVPYQVQLARSLVCANRTLNPSNYALLCDPTEVLPAVVQTPSSSAPKLRRYAVTSRQLSSVMSSKRVALPRSPFVSVE
jgi:hypothetical protein